MFPLIERLDTTLTAGEIYARFHREPYSIFLDSGMSHQKLGKYSFIASDPFLVLRTRGSECCLIQEGNVIRREKQNPWEKLQELMASLRRPYRPELPPLANGGAIGYLAYDLGRWLEKIPCQAVDDYSLPEMYMGFYDSAVIVDHVHGNKFVVSSGRPSETVAEARRRLVRLKEKVLSRPADCPAGARGKVGGIQTNFTRDTYCQAVKRAKEYIAAGDIYQVNLSQRMETNISEDPFSLYWRLRHLNPAPFAAYLHFPEVVVASASPERFLKVRGRQVQTRPIKGTRPRGGTPAADRAMREELLSSTKDRAELVMIVDLERNDLSRVCMPGSIRVPRLFELETYATVYHLVATVEGTLAEGRDTVDLLKASFPGGSITGAPKIRAMEIIEELEPVRRSVYTGSIGYLGFDGNADLSIVIRTFIIKGDRAFFQVGGGIVADSDPEAEYQETLDKAQALLASLGAGTLEGGKLHG